MKRSIVFFGKMFICLTLIFALKSAMVETNKVATAEIGGWWGGNQGRGHDRLDRRFGRPALVQRAQNVDFGDDAQ